MRTKRLAAAISIALMLQALTASAAFPPEAYEDAVALLANAKIIDGYSAGNPRVYDYVTRAEALKIILRSRAPLVPEVSATASSMPPIPLFPDTDQSAWYAPYVEVGFRYGLVKGYPDGSFWPQAGVKVAEAAAMIARANGFAKTSVAFQTSPDLPNAAGQWYTDSVSAVLQRNGIMPGSRLRLDHPMTRGALFDMVYRMMVAERGGAVPGSQPQTPSVPAYAPASPRPPSAQPVYPVSPQQYASQEPFALTIPSLNIYNLKVIHPKVVDTQKGVLEPLKEGVGHLFSYPGEGGKIMIYGHSSGYPWDLSAFTKIFRTINKLELGDRIYVTYEETVFVYEVTEQRAVPAKDMSDFNPDNTGEKLILYTCWPPDNITYRYLVFARPVEKVALR